MNRVFRLAAVLIGLVGVAVVIVAGTRTWAHVTVPDISGMQDMPLSGRRAATLAMPVALAAAAGVIVMASTGRIIRFLVAALVLVGGVAIVVNSLDARAHAAEAATKALESTLDVFNQGSLLKLPASSLANAMSDLTVWPTVSVAGGVLVALSGLIALVTGVTWPDPPPRFESAAARPAPERVPAGEVERTPQDARTWDALSRGEDPT